MDSNASETSKSEHVIENVAGCGPFQVVLVILVAIVTNLSLASTLLFMSFGNYNPGWRCLDVNATFTHHDQNESIDFQTVTQYYNEETLDPSTRDFTKDNCPVFESCHQIEFAPGTSTIVTEWGLLCANAWIPSIIISLQMSGMLVGCVFAGHLGDAFGRKKAIYTSQALVAILNIISIFAPSWQIFAALRFLLGLSLACIATFHYVYMAEFVTIKWRGPLGNIPCWSLVCGIFAVICMILKDWRHIHIVISIIAVVGFLPALWLPESLRWLEAKEKIAEFQRAARKITKMNGKILQHQEGMELRSNDEKGKNEDVRTYNLLDIFKRGYLGYTLFLTVPSFSVSLILFALNFGVSTLSGDFYLNMIIMNTVEAPISIVSACLPNLLGRKKASILFAGISGSCLIAAACLHQFTSDNAKTTGVLILVLIAKTLMGIFKGFMYVHAAEIYPTVVRGVGTSWCTTISRVGGIIAPFLIPNEQSAIFICYTAMGVLAVICCGAISKLPETKGKTLKQNFDGKADTEDV